MPNKRGEEIYYAWIMTLGLAVVFWWAQSQVKDGEPPMRIAVGFASLALASWVSCIVVGNNPLLVVPLLILCYQLLRANKDGSAGVVLALAMLKPTVAGPFFLVLLLRRRWRAAAMCLLYIILASLLTWRLIATNPLEMLKQMFAASGVWIDQGFGPAQYLMWTGVDTHTASLITAPVVLAFGCWALFLARDGTLLAQFSIAAIIARFWSYHLYYDDAVMVLMLVFFAHQTLGPRARTAYIGFILSCVGLWIPQRVTNLVGVQLFQLLAWLVLACLIVSLSRPNTTGRRKIADPQSAAKFV